MSEARFKLAEELTNSFYVEILGLGGWHSNLVSQIQEQDKDISSAIEKK